MRMEQEHKHVSEACAGRIALAIRRTDNTLPAHLAAVSLDKRLWLRYLTPQLLICKAWLAYVKRSFERETCYCAG